MSQYCVLYYIMYLLKRGNETVWQIKVISKDKEKITKHFETFYKDSRHHYLLEEYVEDLNANK